MESWIQTSLILLAIGLSTYYILEDVNDNQWKGK